jgi:hypothetical protein
MPARSVDHGELVAERQDFEVQRRARPDEELKRGEPRPENGRHDLRLPENARNLNRCNAYGVSGRHSFKFRNKIGIDVAVEALKDTVVSGKAQSTLFGSRLTSCACPE